MKTYKVIAYEQIIDDNGDILDGLTERYYTEDELDYHRAAMVKPVCVCGCVYSVKSITLVKRRND